MPVQNKEAFMPAHKDLVGYPPVSLPRQEEIKPSRAPAVSGYSVRGGFRVKGLGFSLIIISCMFFAFLYPNPYTLNPAFATDSSPSASIQSKLKDLQAEIASRAAAIKNEVSKKLLNKAYTGIIKNKGNASLTVNLKTDDGNINVSEFTEYIIKSKTLIGDNGLKNLNVSDSIAALGDIDDKGALTAKRIIKLTKPVILKKVIHGSLVSVATASAILKTNQNDQFAIIFDKNTDYQIGKTDGNFKDITANQWIIAVVEPIAPAPTSTTENQPQTLLAKFVYIFPTTLSAKPKTSSDSSVKK